MNRNKLLLRAKRFRVELASHRGKDGVLDERAVVRHPGAVAIAPMVDAEHVCLIKNFRVAVGRTLIELPAGTLEPEETPEV
ncbi:MAG: NUDIX hydrolase, partial [Planctomycetota bacterium]